jgi:hypothetical protein
VTTFCKKILAFVENIIILSFNRFFCIVSTMSAIAIYVLWNLYKNCSVSEEDTPRLNRQEMIEMSDFMDDRKYIEEPGKILLPQGA